MPAYVTRRGNQYLFRRVVPDVIRTRVGKREIKQSLGSDFKEAKRLAAILTVETDEIFLAAQNADKQESTEESRIEAFLRRDPAKRLKVISRGTQELADRYVAFWLASLESDLRNREHGMDEEDYQALQENIREIRPILNLAIATGNVERFYPSIYQTFHGRGYELKLSPDEMHKLARQVVIGMRDGYEILAERQNGNLMIPTLKARPLPAAWEDDDGEDCSIGPTWEELFDRWKTDRDRSGTRTVEEAIPIWNSLGSFCGKITPSQLTKAMITDWLKKLRTDKNNQAKTLEKKGTLAGAIFAVAVKDDLLNNNPFAQYDYKRFFTKIGTEETQSREPFVKDDLLRIFSLTQGVPIYGNKLDGGGGVAARDWIPLIGLFTGARLDEIGYLHTDNVKLNGLPYIKITRGKNKSALRDIPIHPKLIELGFSEFVRNQGTGYLFPGLITRKSKEPDSEIFGRWFNRTVHEKLGLPHTKVFHSFRHTFKDACRNAGIPRDIHQALTGHSNSDVGDSYGFGHSLEVKAEQIAKIEFGVQFYRPRK